MVFKGVLIVFKWFSRPQGLKMAFISSKRGVLDVYVYVDLRFLMPFCGFTLYYGLWANGGPVRRLETRLRLVWRAQTLPREPGATRLGLKGSRFCLFEAPETLWERFQLLFSKCFSCCEGLESLKHTPSLRPPLPRHEPLLLVRDHLHAVHRPPSHPCPRTHLKSIYRLYIDLLGEVTYIKSI